VLTKLRDQWKGTLVFIAQPAEEVSGGALPMLAAKRIRLWIVRRFILEEAASPPLDAIQETPPGMWEHES
jgi:hypothetical protein